MIKTMSQGIQQQAANCNEAKRSEENPEQDEKEQLRPQPAGGGEDQQSRGEPVREQQRIQQQQLGGGGERDQRLGRRKSLYHLLSTQVYLHKNAKDES